MQYYSGEEVWRSLGTFGRCYASQNPKGALELIATEPDSRAEVQTYKKLFSKPIMTCLVGLSQLNVPHTMVRGAIAEGLYRKGIALSPNLVWGAPKSDEGVHSLTAVVRCYTASQSEQVRALIMNTRPGSKKESAELQKMMPEFGKCIPQGIKVNLSATQVRFRLAEALYRMAPASSKNVKEATE
jgi:hypothetical protein